MAAGTRTRRGRSVQRLVAQFLAGMDLTARPGAREVAQRTGQMLGRPVILLPGRRPPRSACGLAFLFKNLAVIVVDDSVPEILQIQAAAHESIHLVGGHEGALVHAGTAAAVFGGPSQDPQAAYMYQRARYSARQEREAEGGATAIAAALRPLAPPPPAPWVRPGEDAMLRLAAAALGAA
jgi:hypothetical protein